ncbi:membrane protein insertion efficiency factor YidD [Actinoplanes sp. G11-F43]|uniref:membrane protein insertion efficiency factor YidD n=1 Tax=Actinoplanes sp. G11-F43 TaxID=3424130 RepID=UPI003D3530BB
MSAEEPPESESLESGSPSPDEPKKKRDWDCDPGCCECSLPFCDLFSLSTLMLVAALFTRTSAPRRSWGERAVTGAIRAYRRISPRLPTRCRYQPTCSAYGLQAIERHGLRAGLRLTAARLVRCRPGVPFGTADPVP